MLSKRFGENLFDEMFDDPFELMPMFSRHNPLYGKHAKALMKTDVREKDNSYEIQFEGKDLEMISVKHENVRILFELPDELTPYRAGYQFALRLAFPVKHLYEGSLT